MSRDFSARESAIGYLYQSRYALYLLLKRIDGDIAIEKLDDITFEEGFSPLELLQLKHHVNSAASLTNSCSDLWKTVRIWCDTLKKYGTISRLTLVTTSIAPRESVAFYLKDNSNRDPLKAKEIMLSVISSSKNKANQVAYESFRSLTPDQQLKLVENIYIVDGSPDIIDIIEEIKKQLALSVRKNQIDALYERLEGWWLQRVILHLINQSKEPISGAELTDKIHDIADQLRTDNLPIDYQVEVPTDPREYDGRQFVKQLQIISLSEKRIEFAVRDYYRAFMQRSRWVSDQLISIGELERYERRLYEAWEEYFTILIESGIDDLDDQELEEKGRILYNRIMQSTHLHIRPSCTEPYVFKGSYHILADKEEIPIGWHPNFKQIIQKLRNVDAEGAVG